MIGGGTVSIVKQRILGCRWRCTRTRGVGVLGLALYTVRGRCARRRNDIELRLIRPQQSDYIQNEGGCATAIGSTGRSNNITGRGMIPVYLGVTTKYGRKGTGICMYV